MVSTAFPAQVPIQDVVSPRQVHLGPGLEEENTPHCRHRRWNSGEVPSSLRRVYLVQFFTCTWTSVRCRSCHEVPGMDFWIQNSGDCSASSSSVQFRCADLCFQSSFPCFVAIASILISCITTKTQCVRGLPVRLRHCRSLSKPGDYVLPF